MSKFVPHSLIVLSIPLLISLITVPEAFAYVQAAVSETAPEEFRNPNTVVKASGEVEIIQISPVIVLKGYINGKQANVLFDTGSWPNAIARHMKSSLSGAIEEVDTAKAQYEVCRWDNLQVGHFFSVNKGSIPLLDLSLLVESVGSRIDAIAGTPFAAGREFKIDFESKKFLIEDRPKSAFYEIVKDIEFDKLGRPWIELEIGTHREKFLVDTGFSGFLGVNQSLAESLEKNGFAKKSGEVEVQFYADGIKTEKKVLIAMQTQNIFGYEFQNMPVQVSNSPESENTIGLKLLEAFNVSLDLKHAKHSKLRLIKNGNYSLSDGCTIAPKQQSLRKAQK